MQSIFTTNHWVCADNWLEADDLYEISSDFNISQPDTTININKWINSFFYLVRPLLYSLYKHRDLAIRNNKFCEDSLLDRDLEIPSMMKFNFQKYIKILIEKISTT